VDVRVIAATKVDLKERIAARQFRDDLFYRINVVPINLPALSERREDIPLLVSHFCTRLDAPSVEVDNEAMALLMAYHWPGNVRELKNVMARLMLVRQNKRVGVIDLPLEIRERGGPETSLEEGSFDEIISSIERRLLVKALENANGNKTRAAELLKMTPSTFRYKLSALNLD
jgi:DNA-binding NtrC family response regulator